MTPITMLSWLLFALIIIALFVAGFVAVSWYLGCRRGLQAVAWSWVLGALVIAALYAVRLHFMRAALGRPFPLQREAIEFGAYALFWFITLSGPAWLVQRRLRRRTADALTLSTTAAGVGAFFVVLGLLLVVVLATDVWRLVLPR